MKKIFLSTFFLLAAASSCKVGPNYRPPYPQVPVEWKNQGDTESSSDPVPIVCNWWEIFHDSILNDLEQKVIESNPNLYTALGKIEEAWALVGISAADLFPQLNLQPTYNNSEQLFKLYLPPGASNNPAVTSLGTFLTTPFRAHVQQYTLPLNLSYELDLWGKHRSRYDSAYANLQSQQEAYNVALLSLTSDLANSYLQSRILDAMIISYENTIELRRQGYELAKKRYENQITTYADVASASLELANTEMEYNEALRLRGLQENIVALLIGVPASEFYLPRNPLYEDPPVVPKGLPISILQRRPDIAQAEREMAAQNGLTRSAYADLYPSISLTGSLGFLSPTFADFLTWLSRYWAMGANLSETVFDAGRKLRNVDAEWARFAQTTGAYRQQVLIAFKEVEDSLNNLEYQKKETDALLRSMNNATQLTKLSSSRYRNGVANYIEVITNERSELDAQRNYLNALSSRYQSTVLLIKALGGGWDNVQCIETD